MRIDPALGLNAHTNGGGGITSYTLRIHVGEGCGSDRMCHLIQHIAGRKFAFCAISSPILPNALLPLLMNEYDKKNRLTNKRKLRIVLDGGPPHKP